MVRDAAREYPRRDRIPFHELRPLNERTRATSDDLRRA